MEASLEHKTVSEHATNYAALHRHKLQDKILYTGRVLVKKHFEHTELPASENYDHLQYYGPELTAVGRFMNNLLRLYPPREGEDLTPHFRIRTLNQAAINGSEPVVVYDKNGRIYN